MWNSPYYSYYPSPTNIKGNTIAKIFQGVSFQKILDGTQRTLGIINQAIPIYQQMKPIWNNAKTFLQITHEINKKPINKTENFSIKNSLSERSSLSNSPTFFSD